MFRIGVSCEQQALTMLPHHVTDGQEVRPTQRGSNVAKVQVKMHGTVPPLVWVFAPDDESWGAFLVARACSQIAVR